MFGSRHAVAVAALSCFALFTASERAHACSPVANSTLEVVEDHTGEAPSGIGDPSVTVNRGNGPNRSGCGQSSTSCDDMGSFQIHFGVATDADSPPRSVGYRVEVIAGTAPAYSLDEYTDRVVVPPLAADADGRATLYFHWNDGDTDDQESIDFTITLTPVDANGNEGPTSDPIRISDDGGGGCSVGEHRIDSSWTAASTVLIAVAVALSRRAAGRRSRRSR